MPMPVARARGTFLLQKNFQPDETDFLTAISAIPGVGPRRVEAFKEAGIESIGDLLYHYPRRYVDRSVIVPIKDLDKYVNAECSVIGTVTHTRFEPGRRKRFRIQLSDSTGALEVLWFAGVEYFRRSISIGESFLLTGRVTFFRSFQMVHPSIEKVPEGTQCAPEKYLPRYPLSMALRDAGVQQKLLAKAVKWALDNVKHFPQVLPGPIEQRHHFPPLNRCLHEVHFPSDLSTIAIYTSRLRYEELYRIALTLRLSRRKFALPGRSMHPGNLPVKFRSSLPFQLTRDQEKAIATLYDDAASGCRMHRLLQGDVGCGKTLTAFFACLPAINSGCQVAWLTPTEVLAQQTFGLVSSWMSFLGFGTGLLKGSCSQSDKKKTTAALSSGELRFVVGTHALLSSSVHFKKLGMIVIDEQHKFGTAQRLAMQEKDLASDFLLMSATPIPQTLAKTLYGDLDIVSILKGPSGRHPVSTHLVPEHKRAGMEQFVLKEITGNGAQVFYVVPRIEHDDSDEGTDLKDTARSFEELTKGVFSKVKVECLHGQMGPEEKAGVMDDFVRGATKLLVATTVIEVGVDVPAATIVIIENAERFGLAQLHQLRGRVGRGSAKSYCFLMAGAGVDEDSMKRLSGFCRCHDGFEIAEMDLGYRGPGDIVGDRQWGMDDLKMADILRDAGLFRTIQEEIDLLFQTRKIPTE